ncbi:hypothetical protein HUT16_31535 [Kitasatospora sp. NA04385]|uniref:hypothetical protein n=1 Tax=Kitasatospora sp. NA04385 TaxID=2742135 RepID=UPI001591A2DE|nr:hypothetical protein [Kitasatospora sp. NA04385]QKW23015.1 hypothetical protein HUT16_31535 [Kitasatospora sp. NA04385]
MRIHRLPAAALLSTLALTACGPEGPGGAAASAAAVSPLAGSSPAVSEPVELLRKARAAGAVLTSVKATYTNHGNGQVTGSVSADRDGNCVGTLEVEGSGSAQIIRSGTTVWMKPDARLKAETMLSSADRVGDKWLAYSAHGITTASQLADFCDLGLELQEQAGVLEGGGEVHPIGAAVPKTVDGVEALTFHVRDLTYGELEIVVTRAAEPHLLSLSGDTIAVAFGEFDAPVQAAQPPSGQLFNGGKLLDRVPTP